EEITQYRRIFGNEHKCKKCPYFTRSVFAILNHSRFHNLKREPFNCGESTPEKFFCGKCEFSTHFLVTFREHIKSHYQRQSVTKERKIGRKQNAAKFECNHCEFQTKNKFCLKQ